LTQKQKWQPNCRLSFYRNSIFWIDCHFDGAELAS
jgi:hypothetical protein